MYAVWKYDRCPYVLTGKIIGEIDDDGLVLVEHYNMRFRPVKIVSNATGRALDRFIQQTRARKRELLKTFREEKEQELKKLLENFQ